MTGSRIKNKKLTEAEANGFIAAIARHTRHHPEIARGASVRGALAFKQVLEGYTRIGKGRTRASLEKAAMITLPPRIQTRQGDEYSAEAVIRSIVMEVLYGAGSPAKKRGSIKDKNRQRLSLADFMAALQNLSLSKALEDGLDEGGEDGIIEIVPDGPAADRHSPQKMPGDSRSREIQDWRGSLESILKDLMGELEQKLINGEISEGDYKYQKKKLEDMLNTADFLESGISEREIAETITEIMEAGDKQWQKDLEFQDMYVYYHIRETQDDSGLTYPKRNWYALKVIVDFLENRELVEPNEEGTSFAVTSQAIDLVLSSMLPSPGKNGGSRADNRRIHKNATERRQDTRRYTTGDVFRDISVRRTLREIARRKHRLSEVDRRDLRIFLKEDREPKSDIMLCVDTSGSMGFHRKLIMARLTAAAIARAALRNGDRVGVVTFDDLGRSVVPPTDKEGDVFRYIAGITSGGNTNIGDGLKCAGGMLRRETGRNRKIILLTDGEPTAISEQALSNMGKSSKKDMTGEYAVLETRKAAMSGIETSVVHIADNKSASRKLVENIARTGHGEVKRITRPEDLKKVIL